MMVAVYCGNPEKGTGGFSLPRRFPCYRGVPIRGAIWISKIMVRKAEF